jgi:hypothetical protein
MATFQLIPEIPKHPNPTKPSDYLGHMAEMCSDVIKDIDDTKELPLMKKVLLRVAIMELRKNIKKIHGELNQEKKP